jgi:hypothetical protein
MSWRVRVAAGLAACLIVGATATAQEPPAKGKARVELRWLETKPIEGLTDAKGFQASCDPKDIVYPHQKPAVVLTAAEVAEARLTKHESAPGSGWPAELFTVTLNLTKEAREKLAATTDGNEMKLLTVTVDGKHWCVFRYEKDKNKPFVPADARAETFKPGVGFFSTEAEAKRLVDAVK